MAPERTAEELEVVECNCFGLVVEDAYWSGMDSACVTCSTPARFSFVVARPLSTSRLEKSGAGFGEQHLQFRSATPFRTAVTGRGHSPRPVSLCPVLNPD